MLAKPIGLAAVSAFYIGTFFSHKEFPRTYIRFLNHGGVHIFRCTFEKLLVGFINILKNSLSMGSLTTRAWTGKYCCRIFLEKMFDIFSCLGQNFI